MPKRSPFKKRLDEYLVAAKESEILLQRYSESFPKPDIAGGAGSLNLAELVRRHEDFRRADEELLREWQSDGPRVAELVRNYEHFSDRRQRQLDLFTSASDRRDPRYQSIVNYVSRSANLVPELRPAGAPGAVVPDAPDPDARNRVTWDGLTALATQYGVAPIAYDGPPKTPAEALADKDPMAAAIVGLYGKVLSGNVDSLAEYGFDELTDEEFATLSLEFGDVKRAMDYGDRIAAAGSKVPDGRRWKAALEKAWGLYKSRTDPGVQAHRAVWRRTMRLESLATEAAKLAYGTATEIPKASMMGIAQGIEGSRRTVAGIADTMRFVVDNYQSIPLAGSFLDATKSFLEKNVGAPESDVDTRLSSVLLAELERNGVSQLYVKRNLLERCKFVNVPSIVPGMLSATMAATSVTASCDLISARVFHLPRLDMPDKWLCYDIEQLHDYVTKVAEAKGVSLTKDTVADAEGLVPHPLAADQAFIAMLRQEAYLEMQRTALREGRNRNFPLNSVPPAFKTHFTKQDLLLILEWYDAWKVVTSVCRDATDEQMLEMIRVGEALVPTSRASDDSPTGLFQNLRGLLRSTDIGSGIVDLLDWVTAGWQRIFLAYVMTSLVRVFLCSYIRQTYLLLTLQKSGAAAANTGNDFWINVFRDMQLQLVGRLGEFLFYRLYPLYAPAEKFESMKKQYSGFVDWIGEKIGVGPIADFAMRIAIAIIPKTLSNFNATLGWIFYGSLAVTAAAAVGFAVASFYTAGGALGVTKAVAASVATGYGTTIIGLISNIGIPWIARLAGIYFAGKAADEISTWAASVLALGPLGMGFRASQDPGYNYETYDPANAAAPYNESDLVLGINPKLLQTGISTFSQDPLGAITKFLVPQGTNENPETTKTWNDYLNKFLYGDVSSMSAWANIFLGPEIIEFLIGTFSSIAGVSTFRIPDGWKLTWRRWFVSLGFARMFFQIAYDLLRIYSLPTDETAAEGYINTNFFADSCTKPPPAVQVTGGANAKTPAPGPSGRGLSGGWVPVEEFMSFAKSRTTV
jgi:hypothetical protein